VNVSSFRAAAHLAQPVPIAACWQYNSQCRLDPGLGSCQAAHTVRASLLTVLQPSVSLRAAAGPTGAIHLCPQPRAAQCLPAATVSQMPTAAAAAATPQAPPTTRAVAAHGSLHPVQHVKACIRNCIYCQFRNPSAAYPQPCAWLCFLASEYVFTRVRYAEQDIHCFSVEPVRCAMQVVCSSHNPPLDA